MLNCGWEVGQLGRNDYYEKDGEKRFCLGNFQRSYLLVLLQSDSLLEGGMDRVFHGQSKSYYDAILALAAMGHVPDLQPNRPAAEYKELVQKMEGSQTSETIKSKMDKGGTEKDDDSAMIDIDEMNFASSAKAEAVKAQPGQKSKQPRSQTATRRRTDSASARGAEESDIEIDGDGPRSHRPQLGSADALGNTVAAASFAGQELEQKRLRRKERKKEDADTMADMEGQNDDHDLDLKTEKVGKQSGRESEQGMQKRRRLLTAMKTEAELQQEEEVVSISSSENEDDEDMTAGHSKHAMAVRQGLAPENEAEGASAASTLQADSIPGGPSVPAEARASSLQAEHAAPIPEEPSMSPSQVAPVAADARSTLQAASVPVEPSAPSSEGAASGQAEAFILQVDQAARIPEGPASSRGAIPQEAVASGGTAAASSSNADSATAASGSASGSRHEKSSGARGSGPPSSLFNLSTVWISDIPIIKRSDKGTESWKQKHLASIR